MPRARPWLLLPVLLVGILAGCPHARRGGNGPASQEVPAILWSVQLEGDPWPQGLLGGSVLVWIMRVASEGFRFPIQLAAYAPADGKGLWATPIRPWLAAPTVPWSHSLVAREPVVGAWVKGDVVRLLGDQDGADAWSLPRSRGLVGVPAGLVTTGAQALWLLAPKDGRTLHRHPLPAAPVLPLVAQGGRVVLALPGGRLQVMDPVSGKVRWERPLPGGAAREAGWLQVAGERLLVAQAVPAGDAAGAILVALDGRSGAVLWEARVPAGERPASASALARLHVAGDLVIWPDPKGTCLRAFEVSTGKERFRSCELRLESPVTRFGDVLYALGADPRSAAALERGEPWYGVDFPLVTLDARTGQRAAFTLRGAGRRRRARHRAQSPRVLRATRLPFGPPSDGVLYLLQRNKFLTALRVGFPAPAAPATVARPAPGRP